MDVDFDAHTLDNAATKQNLVKSTEFLENGNARKNSLNCKSTIDIDATLKPTKNGKFVFATSFDFPREPKRVSTSYVDRYFDQPKYFDDELGLDCAFDDEKLEKFEKLNNFEQSRSTFWSNFQDRSPTIDRAISGTFPQNKMANNETSKEKSADSQSDDMSNLDITKEKGTVYDSPRSKNIKFDSPNDKLSNFDLGTRPKIPGTLVDPAKFAMSDLTKKFDLQKSRGGKVPFVPRIPSQEGKTSYTTSESVKTNVKNLPDSPRGNLETVRINIQSFRKVETNKNGHDNYPFVISNNPLFIAEPEKKESPIYSSSESLRVNFQRLRRKSDAETNNQVELSSKIFAEKYQREVSGLESVKNYLDSKKGQGFNLGLGKLTQNMIQLGKNIAQNSRNLESSVAANSLSSNIKNVEGSTITTPLRSLNVPLQKPNHLDLNIPLQKPVKNMKLNLTCRPNAPVTVSPTIHQHILEPPKLYANENSRKELQIKPEIINEKLQATSNSNVYRHRTSSLSENRKPPLKNIRRSFHPGNESSEDSDSISHSETDIRSRLRFKRRHKKVPHSLRLNLKNKAQFLHPDTARGFSAVELSGKSPPPSTSFLNSLSPPFSSRNNLLSWPESAPSSSLTFTSNSDLDSDTSSEYPEFTSDLLTFPPSPAP